MAVEVVDNFADIDYKNASVSKIRLKSWNFELTVGVSTVAEGPNYPALQNRENALGESHDMSLASYDAAVTANTGEGRVVVLDCT